MKVLVKLEANWADEFDVEGFKVFDSEQHWLDHYKENIEDQEWYFGTNEFFDQGELTEDDFTVTPISEETYAALSLTLGCTFGHFPG